MDLYYKPVINVFQSKGGVGASVIAAAIALQSNKRTALVDHSQDLDGILAVGDFRDSQQVNDNLLLINYKTWQSAPNASLDFDLIVHDWNIKMPRSTDGTNVYVTNGCYLSLKNFVRHDMKADVMVFIDQPGRALTAEDARRVVNPAHVIVVPSDPAIARAVDAGLFQFRMPDNLRKPFARKDVLL